MRIYRMTPSHIFVYLENVSFWRFLETLIALAIYRDTLTWLPYCMFSRFCKFQLHGWSQGQLHVSLVQRFLWSYRRGFKVPWDKHQCRIMTVWHTLSWILERDFLVQVRDNEAQDNRWMGAKILNLFIFTSLRADLRAFFCDVFDLIFRVKKSNNLPVPIWASSKGWN